MTFGQYLQSIGVILAQWLPVCGLFYLAVRMGITHAIKGLAREAVKRDS